jgi:hypothetical protein
MMFGQDEGFAASRKPVTVTLLDCFGGFTPGHTQVLGCDRQVRACREADQVEGVRRRKGLVKVIYAPDQAAFFVAPGTEIFDVQVAYAENERSLGDVATNLRPVLKPAVKRGAEKREGRFGHERMLQGHVAADDREAPGQPLLEILSCLEDIHRVLFVLRRFDNP